MMPYSFGSYVPPKSTSILCHYTTYSSAKMILTSHRLRVSKIANSNDPVEVKRTFLLGANDFETQENIETDLQEYLNNILRMLCFSDGTFRFVDEDIDSDEILSFGSRAFYQLESRPPFFLPRMWALYGQNHSGVCLVFDKGKMIKNVKKTLSKNFSVVSGKMKYLNLLKDGFLYTVAETQEFSMSTIRITRIYETIQNYLQDFWRKNYFSKDSDWNDEHEYRFLCWNKLGNTNFDNIYVDFKEALVGVVFGVNTNIDKKLITQIKSMNAGVYQISFDNVITLSIL